ncbi:formylglycine-generating enzyme family protein [Bremerella sp. T1]|uniref:formylglycine-generating enzyme family protein n=1 Tax=Bremerella sp. TYQ1 TaxID=3119568 RepID=UPI001CCDB6E6|nr:formylglycine-generating enzyme family protein [Bremerella volcania]UBM35870.1 formylglycine-generating enzyme family protein [Bremerella volcania]
MNRYVVGGVGVASVVVLAALTWLFGSLLWAMVAVTLGLLLGGGFAGYRHFQQKFSSSHGAAETSRESAPAKSSTTASQKSQANDSQSLARQMIDQGRYALLLRPQIAQSIPPKLLDRAQALLDDEMTLVPGGETIVGKGANDSPDLPDHLDGRIVQVEGFYLDRFQVTNEQYHRFVEAGGYEQISLWDPEIVPALLDFVDLTGAPGPRFWKHGKFVSGQAKHPVVGVCWYEAAAYARWVGKRLPTDPEWVKSGSWPVPLPGARPIQRKFPWGEAFDQNKCNLWGAGHDSTVPVDKYDEGMSVGGANQLIGNVWEWTSSRFGAWQSSSSPLVLDASMRSIRGGAFDTYFETQATCDFQSGDKAVARKRNIGFRCAIGICDLIPDEAMQAEQAPAQVDHQELAEVSP